MSNNTITVSIDDAPTNNISVYIDETGIGIRPILNFISLLSSTFNINQQVISTVLTNSANWEETFNEVNVLQDTLSANWQETFSEVNILQDTLSANWEKTYDIVKSSIVDGGTF